MTTALVCIAKGEDNYIDEWIDYHLKLGFDFVYVYQNNWRYTGDKTKFNRVHWIEFDGENKQIECYQNFVKYHSNEYDWAAFFDVDEYLCFKGFDDYFINGQQTGNSINVLKFFLSEYEDYNAVGINWRFFGNNSLTSVKNNDYSTVSRFIMADYSLNPHIKIILHTAKTRFLNIKFLTPHNIKEAQNSDFTVNTMKTQYIHGAFNYDFDMFVQLNHYYTRTLEEFMNIKHQRGMHKQNLEKYGPYDMQKFSEANKNDIEDLAAKKFYCKTK